MPHELMRWRAAMGSDTGPWRSSVTEAGDDLARWMTEIPSYRRPGTPEIQQTYITVEIRTVMI